jgi:hypothetical protein
LGNSACWSVKKYFKEGGISLDGLIYLLIESILEFLLNVFLITKVLFIDLVD